MYSLAAVLTNTQIGAYGINIPSNKESYPISTRKTHTIVT